MELVSILGLASELKTKGEDAFRRAHNHSFLVVDFGPEEAEDFMDPRTRDASRCDIFPGSDKIPWFNRAIALVKSNRNAFLSKLTIGRSRNNDIVIRSPKISKLHAIIFPEPGAHKILDPGSANGTAVNGVRLQADKNVLLHNHDRISLWHYHFIYHDLDSFLKLIA